MAGPAVSDSNCPTRCASASYPFVTTIHPAHPDSSCAPRTNLPPLKIPAPIPVPSISTMASFFPRPAPRQVSPKTAAFRSLSTTTGALSAAFSRFPKAILCHPFKFGAHTVPSRRTRPGTATPTAATFPLTPSPPANSRDNATICFTGAREELASTLTFLRCRSFPSRLANATASLVPPRSTASTCLAVISSFHLNRHSIPTTSQNDSPRQHAYSCGT